MVRLLFRNSNRKLRSTFWGSPFIPVGMNQTECCLPFSNFSVPSRFQTHATQIRPFLDSNHNGCGISTVNWQIVYYYPCDTPTSFFCQMVSTQGFYHGCLTFRDSYVQEFIRGALTSSVLTAMGSYLLGSYLERFLHSGVLQPEGLTSRGLTARRSYM